MATLRQETWGSISYDSEADEFVGEVSSPTQAITVSHPISAGCLVTPACNFRCGFCYGDLESLPPGHLSAEGWARVFERLASWRVMRVDLSGGEPTLRRDIGHIATSALDAGLNVVVSTNGSVLASPIEKFNRNVRIHVSLDSGFSEVHERSRILPGGMPSSGSFDRVSRFIARAVSEGFRVRVITCVGKHNAEGLFRLGEHLASLRVREWNVSRVLAAGRAQTHYADHWRVVDRAVTDQIHDMRKAYPFIRIRFSSRVADEGYFLLVLNDGTVATQYTNGRDKVRLGNIHDLSVEALRSHPLFRFDLHARKWLAAIRERYDSVA